METTGSSGSVREIGMISNAITFLHLDSKAEEYRKIEVVDLRGNNTLQSPQNRSALSQAFISVCYFKAISEVVGTLRSTLCLKGAMVA